jgi:hypothetical protein
VHTPPHGKSHQPQRLPTHVRDGSPRAAVAERERAGGPRARRSALAASRQLDLRQRRWGDRSSGRQVEKRRCRSCRTTCTATTCCCTAATAYRFSPPPPTPPQHAASEPKPSASAPSRKRKRLLEVLHSADNRNLARAAHNTLGGGTSAEWASWTRQRLIAAIVAKKGF